MAIKKIAFLIASIFLVSGLVGAVGAKLTFVKFNGKWEEGKSLYSDWYNVSYGYFYGRDVYPIRKPFMNQREKVCVKYNKTRYMRVCEDNIKGYRIRRLYVCRYRIRKGINCSWVEKKVPYRGRKICRLVPYVKQYTRCRWIIKNKVRIGCMNPNGIYTNQLSLSNFKYTLDGVNWYVVPYFRDRIYLNNSAVKFRLDIPENCSPKYRYNRAVRIKYY